MLTSLEIKTPTVFSAPFELSNASILSDPLQILNIDGLGPVEASISTSSYATLDGETYVGSNVGKRNITLTLGLNPYWTEYSSSSDLRQLAYQYFMPKNEVTLIFTSTNLPVCEISGYVESVTPNIFSVNPELQVSIICPFPHFQDVEFTVVSGSVTQRPTLTTTTIPYIGTVPTGIIIDFRRAYASSSQSVLQVINTTSKTESFAITTLVNSTYDVRINTTMGSKSALRVTKTTQATSSVMSGVTLASDWIQLYPGDNLFNASNTLDLVTWDVIYKTKYGGL